MGTLKGDLEAELRKFSSSRSARFLKELARFLSSWRSASAEERTSRQPLDMKEKAFSAVAIELVETVGAAALADRASGGLKFIFFLAFSPTTSEFFFRFTEISEEIK